MGGDVPSSGPVSSSRENSLWFPRFRKRGEKILHSKYIVICVIFLTISDCALVIGELILDLYSVKISLQESEGRTNKFMDGLQSRYPEQFQDERMSSIDFVMDRILHVDIKWNDIVELVNVTSGYSTDKNHSRHKRYAVGEEDQYSVSVNGSLVKMYKEGKEHTREEYIAHCLHYASLTVLSILLIEVSLKILCAGSHFVKRKIEVFDAVIILLSFIVDLIFLKGLSDFAISDSIFILAFLLPWRVIRVVNSLVVAVIDHEHVKLRLLYSRKKKLDKTVDNLRNEVDELKGLLHEVRTFCIKDGMEEWKIDNLLGKFAPRRRKDSKFYTLVKLVMSTASVADDKDSVSSGSIDSEINQYTRRESVLNDYDGCSTSNENTVTSYNFLKVPSLYDTGSITSDNDMSCNSADSSRRSSVNDFSIPVPEFIITNPQTSTQVSADIEKTDQQVFPERKASPNQVSPILSRKGASNQSSPKSKHSPSMARIPSPNHLSPNMAKRSSSSNQLSPSSCHKKSSNKKSSNKKKSANQQSPSLSRNNSTNQLSPSRDNSSNQLSPTLSRNNSANQLSPTIRRNSTTQLKSCLSRNNSANELASTVSRGNSTNELSTLSRHNSANQLTPCLSRENSASDINDGCSENRDRVKRSPHRVNFALS